MDTSAKYPFHFSRIGAFDQVRLSTGADLLALEELDQKLWVALACPVKGLEFDSRTLELLDTQKDGRIRANELIEATRFLKRVLRNPEDLARASDGLPASAINDANAEGKRLAVTLKTVLTSLGKAGDSALSVADATGAVKAFNEMPFNGDGVVPAESIGEPEARAAATDLLATVGGEADKSGKQGFTQPRLETFFKDLEAHAAWLAQAEADPAILTLGKDTSAAWDAFAAVRIKVDDFFARCRLAAFDPRAMLALNREEKDFLAIAAKDMNITASEVASFPLARIEGSRSLPLVEGLNPAWADAVAAFREKTVKPMLGVKTALTEAEWMTMRARFGSYEKWREARAGASVEKLGAERVKLLLAGPARKALEAALASEADQKPIAESIVDLERLVRYRRDLLKLANNFVSFREFYGRVDRSIFQAGTLYLDQRSCELCVRVDDAGKHASLAPLSRMYLAYCDITRPATGQKATIAAAFTAGDSDNLMVGRNGVFYDREGNDWDATITKIVDNPISIRQAFWSPYKKLLRFIEEQVAKRAAAADSAANDKLVGAAQNVEKGAAGEKPPAEPKKIDIGTVAAIGVAVGGITAALGGMLGSLFGLGMWMPLGLVALFLAISGPSMLIAWLKLRQRSLAALLDANGWAMNSAARVNIPLGASLTRMAVLPPGSSREMSDPFAEKPRPWGLWLFLVAVLALAGAWYFGKLDKLVPERVRSTTVLGTSAPTPPAEAPPPAAAAPPAAASPPAAAAPPAAPAPAQ